MDDKTKMHLIASSVKDDIELYLSDYGVNIFVEHDETDFGYHYFKAKIKYGNPPFHEYSLNCRREIDSTDTEFNTYEDQWESVNGENLWRWLFITTVHKR